MTPAHPRPFSRADRTDTKYRKLAVFSAILFAVVVVILILELVGIKQ